VLGLCTMCDDNRNRMTKVDTELTNLNTNIKLAQFLFNHNAVGICLTFMLSVGRLLALCSFIRPRQLA